MVLEQTKKYIESYKQKRGKINEPLLAEDSLPLQEGPIQKSSKKIIKFPKARLKHNSLKEKGR